MADRQGDLGVAGIGAIVALMRALGFALILVPLACSNSPIEGPTGGAASSGDGGATLGTGGKGASTGGALSSGGTTTSGGKSTSDGGGDAGSGSGDFFGASRCEAAGLGLCDGFETSDLNTSLWKVRTAGETQVEIVADQSARGEQSVHLHIQGGFGYISNESFFPAASNSYFGRMFLRTKRFSKVDWAHWTVAEGAGDGDGSVIRVGGQFRTDLSKNRWGVGSDGGKTGDWTTHDNDPDGNPTEPATDTWVCLEWEHRGSENVTRVFIDGVEHPSLATSATEHGGTASEDYILPQMKSFWFGFWQYQADPEPFDVWIDEVALDVARIGCEK